MMRKTKQDWLREICEKTKMPQEVFEKTNEILPTVTQREIWETADKMTEKSTAEQAWKQLKQLLSEDADGWKMLTVMLATAQTSCEKLKVQGWQQEVIWETMATFSRFVKEHFCETGRYGFDRDFWTWRQLCGQIVRLGCLEYEHTLYTGKEWHNVKTGSPCIMLHIPSDAKLEKEEIDKSLEWAKTIWGNLPFLCESWLLAPALSELLPQTSKLRGFRERFECGSVNLENNAFVKWVFNNTNQPVEQWAEQTSLQKNIKRYVQKGGKIGSVWGYLI